MGVKSLIFVSSVWFFFKHKWVFIRIFHQFTLGGLVSYLPLHSVVWFGPCYLRVLQWYLYKYMSCILESLVLVLAFGVLATPLRICYTKPWEKQTPMYACHCRISIVCLYLLKSTLCRPTLASMVNICFNVNKWNENWVNILSAVTNPVASAQSCSFPFTLNGQLCYQCTANYSTTCDIGCFLAHLVWATWIVDSVGLYISWSKYIR